MSRESAGALVRAHAAGSSRSLSTARAVLRVLALLAERPEGVRADEVAKTLGKSVSTAYYLLTSLCEEGFAVHESKGLLPARPRARAADRGSRAGRVRAYGSRGTRGDRRRAVPADPQALLPWRGAARQDRDRRLPRAPGRPEDARARLRDPGQRARAGDGQGGAFAARRERGRALCGARPAAVHRAHDDVGRGADRRARSTRGRRASRSTGRNSTRTSAASRRRSSTSGAVRGSARPVDLRRTSSTPTATASRRRCSRSQKRPSTTSPRRLRAAACAARPRATSSRCHELASRCEKPDVLAANSGQTYAPTRSPRCG